MDGSFSRTELLLGPEAMRILSRSRVAVFGIGGVGSYAVEALARSGVGALDLIDGDVFDETNLNRQLGAVRRTIGLDKVAVTAERIAGIAPDCVVRAHKLFYSPENRGDLDFSSFDYIIDAVDTVAAKLELAVRCAALNVPLISAMGAGNKLDPTRLRVADIYETSVCPLARVMRRELRKRGVKRLKVVYSLEPPIVPAACGPDAEDAGPHAARRAVPGSTAFVPSAMGLVIAGEVVCAIARPEPVRKM
ncbi:MAG: tRNA threonylcarbamoyladenosine dehydratase [Clostridia bacterium]|nr:tRNA threonylcarbamoyladenosine dehydratase [Clostridia bacterium]